MLLNNSTSDLQLKGEGSPGVVGLRTVSVFFNQKYGNNQ